MKFHASLGKGIGLVTGNSRLDFVDDLYPNPGLFHWMFVTFPELNFSRKDRYISTPFY